MNNFIIASYNILARSLGSSVIPWVMSISPGWRSLIEERVRPMSFDSWKNNVLIAEYKKHFHKNLDCGNKVGMRRLWGLHVSSPGDIPSDLPGVSFISEDYVSYSASDSNNGNRQETAITLHGLLKKTVPDIADALYDHIMKDENVFMWDNRGPKIFHQITSALPELEGSPDLIFLTEYDIHEGNTLYRNDHGVETFPEAMQRSGYSGSLMLAPYFQDGSGNGIYWKRSVFELLREDKDYTLEDEEPECIFSLRTESSYWSAYNFDLHEHCHVQKVSDDGCVSIVRQELNIIDRKNVCFIKLRHIGTGKVLLLIGLHLMTGGRDGKETNYFPGEVRSGELNTIRGILSNHKGLMAGVDAIIMTGDFNIDVEEREKLKGILKSHCSDSILQIETGFNDADDVMNPNFDFVSRMSKSMYGTTGHQDIPFTRHVDFVDRIQPSVCPRKFILHEAFADIHCWGSHVGEGRLCSSFNSKRCSWIDMMWYSSSSLQLLKRQMIQPLLGPIPNEQHGSDHLPLVASFEFK